jgi:hypothetical protein
MGTQAARVALWVPTTAPPQTGDAIVTTAAPGAPQAPIPSVFQLPGAAGYATDAEVQAGVVADKGVSPAGLRHEVSRLFASALDLAGGILATVTSSPDKVVKTGSDGLIDGSLIPAGVLPPTIDAGTF